MAGAKADRIDAVLRRFAAGEDDPLTLFVALFDEIRPPRADDSVAAIEHHRLLRAALAAHPPYRDAVRTQLLRLFAERRQVSFFAGSGMLPDSGFFTELWRKLVNCVLPEAVDHAYLRDAIGVIFHHPRDHLWLAALPPEASLEFWRLLELEKARNDDTALKTLDEMVKAVAVVSHRIAAMGLEREFVRVYPQLEEGESPFIAQNVEVHRYTAAYVRGLHDTAAPHEDEKHLLVLIAQCRDAVRRASTGAMMRGTSLELSYLLTRLAQHIERLETLVMLLAARYSEQPGAQLLQAWAGFVREAVRGENERNSIRLHVSRLIGMLALRVTQNAGLTGEHYITSDRAGYFGMLRSAGGAGVIIGVMALLKIYAAKWGLPPLPAALVYSLNYALGFMLVHVLHLTIATKQPAMTASAIAAAIHQSGGRLREVDRLAALVIDVLRSQFAAICGNVLVAFPVALAIGAALNVLAGAPSIPPEKAEHLLHDINPFTSLAIVHAAIAGVWLFLTGLISGYFDNKAAYDRIPDRVARIRWMNRLLGVERTRRVADYLDHNLGGLVGNFCFGFMLGCTALAGVLTGLDIDIRHIAFASANLAYGAAGLGFHIDPVVFLIGVLGVALVGITNLLVSFALAMWVALKSHGVAFVHTGPLLAAMVRRALRAPLALFWPPKETPVPQQSL